MNTSQHLRSRGKLLSVWAVLIAATALPACGSRYRNEPLRIRLTDTHVNRDRFEVSTKVTLSNDSSGELTDIACSSWQSPEGPNTSWGGGFLNLSKLAANETAVREATFVQGQMQFDRIFRGGQPGSLKIECWFNQPPGAARRSKPAEFILDIQRAQYVETHQSRLEETSAKEHAPQPTAPCAGSLLNMVQLTPPPGDTLVDPSEQWRAMARSSAEAGNLRARWQSDAAKQDRLIDLLQKQDRYALAEEAGLTQEGLTDLRGLTCSGCILRGADLSRVDLSFSIIEGSIESVDLSRSKLFASVFRRSVFSRTWLRDVQAPGSDFSNAVLVDVDFAGADLYATDFRAARVPFAMFYDACMTGASFDNATLNAWWRRATLRHSSWNGATIAGFIENSDLTDAKFGGAKHSELSFLGGCQIDLSSLAGVDFSQGSIGPESFDVRLDVGEGRNADQINRQVGLLRRLVAKAAVVGKHELIDIFYYHQREQEVASMTLGLRWAWEWVHGWVAGWGTRPGRAVGRLAYLWVVCAILFGAISMLSKGGSGLFEADIPTPITTRNPGIGYTRHVLLSLWDLLVFSLTTITRLGFRNTATDDAVVGALLLRRNHLEVKGIARRVAACEWILAKLFVFFLLEGLLKQYWQ